MNFTYTLTLIVPDVAAKGIAHCEPVWSSLITHAIPSPAAKELLGITLVYPDMGKVAPLKLGRLMFAAENTLLPLAIMTSTIPLVLTNQVSTFIDTLEIVPAKGMI